MKEITKKDLLTILDGVDFTYLSVATKKGGHYKMDIWSKERIIRDVNAHKDDVVHEFTDRERPLGFDYGIPNWENGKSFFINTHS